MKDRLKQLRKDLHLTQADVGKVIGISNAGVARIESGASRPTEAALKLICATYRVNYRWLVEGVGPMYQEKTPEDLMEDIIRERLPDMSELGKSIVRAYARMPDEEWERLRDLIDSMKKAARDGRQDFNG